MNNKGQALVEFILIAPILLLILIALVDIGNIFIKKYELADDLSTVSTMYQNNEKKELAAYVSKEEITFTEKDNNNFVTLTLEKKVPVNAPILSNVLGKNFIINVSKNIYKEANNE